MPVDVISGSVSVSVIPDQTALTVGDLAPGTMFRLFTTDQGRGAWNAAGRGFVKSGNGQGSNGKLLKNRYHGDVDTMAMALPLQADDSRAEIIPPKAPQEAASEIVTEAETPASAAPAASPRPRARPSRPAVSQPRPPSDPTAQAVAAAVSTPVPPTPIAPRGPPPRPGGLI